MWEFVPCGGLSVQYHVKAPYIETGPSSLHEAWFLVEGSQVPHQISGHRIIGAARSHQLPRSCRPAMFHLSWSRRELTTPCEVQPLHAVRALNTALSNAHHDHDTMRNSVSGAARQSVCCSEAFLSLAGIPVMRPSVEIARMYHGATVNRQSPQIHGERRIGPRTTGRDGRATLGDTTRNFRR